MKKLTMLLLNFLLFYFAQSQKQGNIWYFGNKAGVSFNTNLSASPLFAHLKVSECA